MFLKVFKKRRRRHRGLGSAQFQSIKSLLVEDMYRPRKVSIEGLMTWDRPQAVAA